MRNPRRLATVVGVLMLLTPAAGFAQERQLGIKAGASIATITSDGADYGSFDPRTGLIAGAFAVLPLPGPIDLQIEAMWTDRGGSQPIENLVQGEGDTRLQFHYFDVPILARVNGPQVGRARLHFFGGPTLGIRLQAKGQIAYQGVGSFGYETDLSEDVRRFDPAITFGAGANVGRLVVDGRYTVSLVDAVKEQDGGPLKNRGFSVMAGFRIF